MRIKKIMSLFLALCMLLPCALLTSCKDNSPTVMSLDGYEFTEAMYSYWASSYKGNYLYTYSDITDTADMWNSDFSDGMTVAEYFDGITLEAVKTNLVTSVLFKENRLSFTDEEKKSIDDYISDLIKERAEGSKNTMNKILGEYGINTSILKNIYLEEEKAAKVYAHLFGEGGTMALTDEDLEAFYLDNFVRVQMIYVENISTYATDEEGVRLTDESGYYVVEALEGEEKEKKDAKVNAVLDGIENGEDFDSLYEEYSELKDYKNGHYYSAATYYDDVFYYNLVAEVEKAEPGEVVTLESEMGTCIMKKLELDSGAWKNKDNEAFFGEFEATASENSYQKLVESYFDKITVDEEIVKKYSVKEIIPAYFF